jgi:glycine/D-amino acid oxidase-like deaminating enzyme/nitrite reductase/ring-hydroxylating ferredoxin subunit
MAESSGTRESIWLETAASPQRPTLSTNANADVCIVGAGISGLSTAYLLARGGNSVIVLDDGTIGSGETGRTTAHVVNVLDDRYGEIERLHGQEGSRRAAESHTKAIDQIEAIVNEEQIDCDFSRLDGYLFVPPGDDPSLLDEELTASRRAGLQEVTKVARAPLPSFDTGPCLRFPRQAQFHPLKYLAGLATAIEARGGRIFTATHASEIKGGKVATIKTPKGIVTAKAVVVATNTPVNNTVAVHTKQAAYRTYVVAMRLADGSVPRALYWDTPDPYHYVRLVSWIENEDLLLVGGEDHKTGQQDDAQERFRRLIVWARDRFPVLRSEPIYSWSGQIMEPNDGMGFIGRNPLDASNVYVATGDSGNGITHGTIAGILLTDLILGNQNPWEELYDPSRISLRAASEFAKENVNFAVQYTDLLSGSEIESSDRLAPDSGAVLRRGLKKIAAYRDPNGQVHEFSAICPHLGCVVHWNSTEKTWDCPCHGSRFAAQGEVLNGPANSGLRRIEPE